MTGARHGVLRRRQTAERDDTSPRHPEPSQHRAAAWSSPSSLSATSSCVAIERSGVANAREELTHLGSAWRVVMDQVNQRPPTFEPSEKHALTRPLPVDNLSAPRDLWRPPAVRETQRRKTHQRPSARVQHGQGRGTGGRGAQHRRRRGAPARRPPRSERVELLRRDAALRPDHEHERRARPDRDRPVSGASASGSSTSTRASSRQRGDLLRRRQLADLRHPRADGLLRRLPHDRRPALAALRDLGALPARDRTGWPPTEPPRRRPARSPPGSPARRGRPWRAPARA